MNARSISLTGRPLPTLAPTSPSLAVVGFLMALAALLNANPHFGMHALWPWELFTQTQMGLTAKTVALLWMGTAVWLLVFSFAPWYRLRSTVAVVLGVVLLFQLEGTLGGIQIQRFYLNEFAPLIGLGAGLLFARNPGTERLGGYVCGVSAIALLVAWSVGFEDVGTTGALTPRLKAFAHDTGVFLTGGAANEFWSPAALDAGYPWHTIAPQLLIFVVAAGSLLVALGLRQRTFVTILFVLLLVGVSAPLLVRVVRVFQGSDPGFASIAQHVFAGLVDDGLCVWLLLSFGITDLIRRSPTNDAWEATA